MNTTSDTNIAAIALACGLDKASPFFRVDERGTYVWRFNVSDETWNELHDDIARDDTAVNLAMKALVKRKQLVSLCKT